MNEEYNKPLLNLSKGLIKYGISYAQYATRNLPYTQGSFGDIKTYLVNVGIDTPISQLDMYYRFVNEKTMHKIWEYMIPIVSELKYTLHFGDCDNFAFLMSSLIPWLFGINTCGAAWGEIDVGMHYFNIFVTSEGKVFCGEPMNGYIIEVKKEEPIKLPHGWTYKIRNTRYY